MKLRSGRIRQVEDGGKLRHILNVIAHVGTKHLTSCGTNLKLAAFGRVWWHLRHANASGAGKFPSHEASGSRKFIEASHTGPHGIGQKSPDSSAIPLCAKHHRTGNDSYHRLGPRKFAQKHNLDIPAIVRRLNVKPTIRIEAGCFIAHLDDRRYVLGKTEAGIRPAVQEAMQLCREVRLSGGV